MRLPWGGEHKLNTAYVSGGFEGLRSTLLLNLRISVDRYAAIDLDGMRRLIDALGGVDVWVRCPLYDVFPDPDYSTLTYPLVEIGRDDQPTRVFVLRAGEGREAAALLRVLRLPSRWLERAPEPDASVPYRIWLGPDFDPCP